MSIKKRIISGIIILIIATILYALFHDITARISFINFSQSKILVFYKNLQFSFISFFQKIPFYSLIQNYLINILFFIGILLICFSFIKFRIKYAIAAFFGVFLEIIQLINTNLGTFDFLDIFLYMIIILCFNFVEERNR